MPSPEQHHVTFELRVHFPGLRGPETKELVKESLTRRGEDTFVEGVIDDLDLDFCYQDTRVDEIYDSIGGKTAPISLYKFDGRTLDLLEGSLMKEFGQAIECSKHSINTQDWQEGWKQSFKTLREGRFVVYPPWDLPSIGEECIGIEIDPGMAFGTGQHQTTRLCLQAISGLDDEWVKKKRRVLDVGAGSGILAIGCKKLGFSDVWATDIDQDAVLACGENFKKNLVDVQLYHGCIPLSEEGKPQKFDLVIANILAVVIRSIWDQLVEAVADQGRLVISGILCEDVEEFTQLASSTGLEVRESRLLDDWGCLVLEKLK